ncbi:MAG TPA: PAN domain-containing protein [Labilithrix sp.]|nr:PAN domain-containing protein [Labilithrix sp.]
MNRNVRKSWVVGSGVIIVVAGLVLLRDGIAEASPPSCGTGAVWRVSDTSEAWKGVWVQQPGGGTTYSGRWLKAGEPTVTAVLVISASGDRVSFRRTDDPNKFQVTDCLYDGTFGADGASASGTVTCNSAAGKLGPFNWTAQISCNDPRPNFEVNIDRPGSDYRHFELEVADPANCWAQCELESECVAFAYVNPDVQGPKASCWLKSSVPAQVPNATFATSGVKGS